VQRGAPSVTKSHRLRRTSDQNSIWGVTVFDMMDVSKGGERLKLRLSSQAKVGVDAEDI